MKGEVAGGVFDNTVVCKGLFEQATVADAEDRDCARDYNGDCGGGFFNTKVAPGGKQQDEIGECQRCDGPIGKVQKSADFYKCDAKYKDFKLQKHDFGFFKKTGGEFIF